MSRPVEHYRARAECPDCGDVVWCPDPTPTFCLCGASGIDAAGKLVGKAKRTNDQRMAAFIEQDRGRLVTPRRA